MGKAKPQGDLVVLDAPPQQLAQADVPISAILDRAISSGMTPEALEKIVGLYERLAALKAKQEYEAAMKRFKLNCPPIPRRTENGQFAVTRNGVRVARKYSALEDISKVVDKPLAIEGLSYRWSGSTITENSLTKSCIVAHEGGHSESFPVTFPIDSKAGCSDQQKVATAMTYAQRYSLMDALGLTSCDEDNDGNAENGGGTITPEQAAEILCLVENAGTSPAKFLAWVGAESVEKIPSAKYAEALSALKRKAKP